MAQITVFIRCGGGPGIGPEREAKPGLLTASAEENQLSIRPDRPR